MSEPIYLIYKHTSPSGKSYIGLTKNLTIRNRVHKLPSSKCFAFSAAIKKYGWELFTTEILSNQLTLKEANVLEAQFIIKYNTLAPHGYNLRAGGDVNILSEETRAKLIANNTNRGKHKSAETKAKMSALRKGKKQTAEHIEKAAVTRRGKACSENRRAAISLSKQNISAETRSKLAIAATGRVMSKELIQKRQATREKNRLLKLKTSHYNEVNRWESLNP
jgi:group I intron endonuclease